MRMEIHINTGDIYVIYNINIYINELKAYIYYMFYFN